MKEEWRKSGSQGTRGMGAESAKKSVESGIAGIEITEEERSSAMKKVGDEIVSTLPDRFSGYELTRRGLLLHSTDPERGDVSSEDTEEFLAVRAKVAIINALKEQVQRVKGKYGEEKQKILQSESVKKLEAYYDKLDNDVKLSKNELEDMMKTLNQTGQQFSTTVKSAYSRDQSAMDYADTTMSLLGKAATSVAEAAQPTADKLSKVNYVDTLYEAYDKMSSGMEQMGKNYNEKFGSWDKMSDFFEKLSTQQRGDNIEPDPNGEGSILSRFQKEIDQRAMVNNSVVNTTSSSNETELPYGIAVRDLYSASRVINLEYWDAVKLWR